MAKFKIPVEWSVYGVVEIEADSIEEAVNKFDETIDDIPCLTSQNISMILLKEIQVII